jgi:hypothetical protein
MDLNEIVAQIDAEISKLTHAKQILLGVATKKGPGRPSGAAVSVAPASPGVKKRKKMSAAGRARISAAMKARWAKKKAVKPAAVKPKVAKPKKAKPAVAKPVVAKTAATA